jgi:microcystin-dependent protein
MDNPIAVGYIVQFAGPNFVPENFLECAGQNLQVGSYQALYSVIGPTYGGDNKTYFTLPDLRPTDSQGNRISYKAAKMPAYIICYNGPNPIWP